MAGGGGVGEGLGPSPAGSGPRPGPSPPTMSPLSGAQRMGGNCPAPSVTHGEGGGRAEAHPPPLRPRPGVGAARRDGVEATPLGPRGGGGGGGLRVRWASLGASRVARGQEELASAPAPPELKVRAVFPVTSTRREAEEFGRSAVIHSRLRQHLLRRLRPRNILGEALFEDDHGCLKDGAISLDSWLAAIELGTRTAAMFSRKSSMDMVSAFPVDGRPLLARWILASLR